MSGEQTFIDDDKVQDDRCLDGLDLKECEERVWKEVHSKYLLCIITFVIGFNKDV